MKKLLVSIAMTLFLLVSCKKDSLPEVETLPAILKDATHVTFNGIVIDEGHTTVTARGFYWGLRANPNANDHYSNNGYGSGPFTQDIEIIPDSTYYTRSYATNSFGTSFGSEVIFRTGDKNVLVTDGDSRTDGWNCSYKYPYWPLLALDEPFDIFNTSFGGLTTADLVSRAEGNVDPKLSISSRFNIVVIWAGVNDIEFRHLPARTVYKNLVSYCAMRKAKGWKVIVCTEVSMKGMGILGVFDKARTLLNNSIRANWVDFADGMADLAANKSIGDIGAYKDTSFFCDGIHLTNAGTVCVAAVISNTVNALIKNEEK